MRCFISPAIIVALILSTASMQQAAEPSRQPSLSDYALVVQRNIFSKTRSVSRRSERTERSPTSYSPPERTYVLTGIVRLDSEYVAYIENKQAGSTDPIHVGQSMAQGKIVRIDIDWLEYEAGGKITRVEIGHALTGESASEASAAAALAAAAAATAGTATTQPAGTASAPPAESSTAGLSSSDILERLKAKRQAELGKIGQ